jgi:NADH pyrophosphatase NudC (nudix superfamily)
MKFCPECGNNLISKHRDGARRFVCGNSNCSYIHWNNPIPVVAALVKLNDKYIIARNAQWPGEIYSLITGYLEYGENVEEAALREVNEELGLEGKIERFLGHYTFSKKNQLIIAFEVHATGSIQTSDEIAAIKALSEAELKEYDFRPLYITEQIITKWST